MSTALRLNGPRPGRAGATLRRRGPWGWDRRRCARPRGHQNVNDADTSASDGQSDPTALRQKYRLERDKRIRRDGNDQYVELAGPFASYLEDPYTEPVTRPPPTTTSGSPSSVVASPG